MAVNEITRERLIEEVVAIFTGKKSVGQIVDQYKREAEDKTQDSAK